MKNKKLFIFEILISAILIGVSFLVKSNYYLTMFFQWVLVSW